MHKHTFLPVFAIILTLSFVLSGTTFAAAPTLMDRVNEALQLAGLPVTPATQQSFATGVANGHYKTFEQLVNAMKWHKAHGRILANINPTKVWVFTGTVTEVNTHRLETVGLNKKGMEILPKFRLTKNTRIKHGTLVFDVSDTIRREVKDEIRRGSVVKVWATPSHEALLIENLAPKGQADFYGPVDCTLCGVATEHVAKPSESQQQEEAPPEQNNED